MIDLFNKTYLASRGVPLIILDVLSRTACFMVAARNELY